MPTNLIELECDALELRGLLEKLKAEIAALPVMTDVQMEIVGAGIALSDKLANALADAAEAGAKE